MELIVTIIIGAVAGWLGSQIFKGSSLGLVGNIVVGIIGGMVGYWLLGKMGVSLGTGLVGSILTGALGAIVILAILNIIFRSK
ncbi:MAG: GlsB/YeaQ/YmgE family stress response membrane protein [Ferruginibacter sp.]